MFPLPNACSAAVTGIVRGEKGMRMAVVGSGYVGLAAAACFAELGHTIISVDDDAAKVSLLNAGDLPIREPFLTELVQQHLGGGQIELAHDPYEAAVGCDAPPILLDWEEFGRLDLKRIRQALKYPRVIDSQNLYEPDALTAEGLTYCGVGRREAVPSQGFSAKASTPS
jgi:UDP-glucose 6-dehydrogenase